MNLLFVSIAFPPKSDPECLQTARYYRALKDRYEVEIQVLTSKSPTLFMDIDNSLQKYLNENDSVLEIPIYESKISNFFLRKIIPGGLDWPDSKYTFHLQWKKALKEIKRPEIIYSRSYPLSSTIMAFRLATYFKVPWVMHLSDPWSISPTHRRSHKNQKYQDQWEKKCFELANNICFTSEATIRAYNTKYPHLKSKYEIIPNVPYEKMNKTPFRMGEKLRIGYTGGLAGQRSPAFFLKALENLIFEKPEIANNIEVVFAGNMDRISLDLFANTRLTCVKHIGNISLDQSIHLQQSSHILLSIDNSINKGEQAMFLPSKILDYINSNKRILALTTKDSSTASFLNDFESNVVAYDDLTNIQMILEKYVMKFEERDAHYFQQEKQLPSEQGITQSTNKLIGLFEKAIK